MNRLNENKFPSFLTPFLWSYDLDQLDLKKHNKIIIKNVLDYGDQKAINWLRNNYTSLEIKKVIQSTVLSEWSPKSINLWLVFNL